MIRVLLAIMVWSAAASPGEAGAWMRTDGEGFLSLGLRAIEPRDTGALAIEQNVYLEYGLRPRLTIGAALNHISGEKSEGTLFLRLPLRDDDRPAKMAAELGIGAATPDGTRFEPFLKTGLSWGRGLSLGGRAGWVNVDGAVQWSTGDAPALFKLDATLGLALSDRFGVMGQAFLEADEYGESVTVVPSLIYTPSRWPVRVVVGLEHKAGRDETTGLRVALWREF